MLKYKKKKVHFVGVGGSGTSAACGIAASYGFEVTGCDMSHESEYLGNLLKKFPKIPIFYLHSRSHLENVDVLAISPAILKFDPQNLELVAAREKRIPILTWQEFMSKFLQRGKFVISVAGTHGKSTVAAMMGHLLEDAGLDPTVEVGALDISWKSNFRNGESKYFVCEADEYNDNFLNYSPNMLVITNIELDHPDYFKNMSDLNNSFQKFVLQMKKPKNLFFGKSNNLNLFGRNLKKIDKSLKIYNYKSVFGLKTKILGDHNSLNANLVAAVGKSLGIKDKIIKKSIFNFKGISRRLEFKGQIGGVKIFDDFAHHPTEVRASLSALKCLFPDKKIWVIFEPHTFSRTKKFLKDFALVFREYVEKVIVVDIFPAREKNTRVVSSQDLVVQIGSKGIYIGSLKEAVNFVSKNLSDCQIIVFMGAGKIYQAYGFFKKVIK